MFKRLISHVESMVSGSARDLDSLFFAGVMACAIVMAMGSGQSANADARGTVLLQVVNTLSNSRIESARLFKHREVSAVFDPVEIEPEIIHF